MKLSNLLFSILLAGIAPATMAKTAYITKVFDYVPAPGQFINQLPEYVEGDTKESIIAKVNDAICGDMRDLVSLGGYGGYVVFGFDHKIVNVKGDYDFKIWGNTFLGSSEPGIVMVSADENGDGIPNDKWYEIAGSEYNSEKTIRNFKITYSKPDSDKDNIMWKSNIGTSGYINRLMFHTQPYYPQWIENKELSFEGSCLPNNATLVDGVYVLNAFDYGYADNHPNTDIRSSIKIDWAVNDDGTPANLEGIDFVKVYNGMNQFITGIGEISTEISGAEDLHIDASVGIPGVSNATIILLGNKVSTELRISNNSDDIPATIYSAQGSYLTKISIPSGFSTVNVADFPIGIYILKTPIGSYKFVKI